MLGRTVASGFKWALVGVLLVVPVASADAPDGHGASNLRAAAVQQLVARVETPAVRAPLSARPARRFAAHATQARMLGVGGRLPFTGADVFWVAFVGIALTCLGAGLRLMGRSPE